VLNSEAAKDEREQPESALPPSLQGSTAPIGENVITLAIQPEEFVQVVDLGQITPGADSLDDDGVMIERKVAEENGWKVGDDVEFWFSQLQQTTGDGHISLPIQALYDKSFAIFGDSVMYFMTQPTFARLQPPPLNVDQTIFMRLEPGADSDAVQAAVEAEIAPVAPIASVVPIGKYVDDQIAPIEGFLNLVYGLLLLAVVVALVGIWNTLLLSIHERTREIGLLRAIGMERRKVRRAVRLEAAVIALFGTLMGIVLGVALSLAFVNGFADQGIKLFLPTGQLVVIAIGGALAGVLAALWPARQAARTDILEAIATN
jgi:putative ABC transport system permease protein